MAVEAPLEREAAVIPSYVVAPAGKAGKTTIAPFAIVRSVESSIQVVRVLAPAGNSFFVRPDAQEIVNAESVDVGTVNV